MGQIGSLYVRSMCQMGELKKNSKFLKVVGELAPVPAI
jgi:hypothetical protein